MIDLSAMGVSTSFQSVFSDDSHVVVPASGVSAQARAPHGAAGRRGVPDGYGRVSTGRMHWNAGQRRGFSEDFLRRYTTPSRPEPSMQPGPAAAVPTPTPPPAKPLSAADPVYTPPANLAPVQMASMLFSVTDFETKRSVAGGPSGESRPPPSSAEDEPRGRSSANFRDSFDSDGESVSDSEADSTDDDESEQREANEALLAKTPRPPREARGSDEMPPKQRGARSRSTRQDKTVDDRSRSITPAAAKRPLR